MTSYELFKQIKHPVDVNDYFHVYNLSNILNVIYWDNFFKQIDGVSGDVVECGVGRGRSLITILALNLFYQRGSALGDMRKIFALDSFQGFPEPKDQDRSLRNPKKGDWSESPNKQFGYSVENLQKILQKAGLGQYFEDETLQSTLSIVEGFFPILRRILDRPKLRYFI